MSELLVTALKVLFLALLWLFILFAANVIRTDMFGRTVAADEVVEPAPALKKPSRAERRQAKKLPKNLRITEGRQAGQIYTLGERLEIGRATDCDLILDDDYVSTNHAVFSLGPSGFVLEDLGSTNGTYVNGVRITSPIPVTPADEIRIGRTEMSLGA